MELGRTEDRSAVSVLLHELVDSLQSNEERLHASSPVYSLHEELEVTKTLESVSEEDNKPAAFPRAMFYGEEYELHGHTAPCRLTYMWNQDWTHSNIFLSELLCYIEIYMTCA